MDRSRRLGWMSLFITGGLVAAVSIFSPTSVAQDAVVAPAAPVASAAVSLRNAITTRVITLKVTGRQGEPVAVTGQASFDRNIDAAWVAVVGYDVKFTHSTEKQINRLLVEVDPMPKIINGKDVEVAGKLGIRDGSGNWDDSYEGTITVAVTAVLSPQ